MRKGDAGRGERSLRVAYIGEDGLPYAENVYSAGDGTLVFGAAISLLNEKWRGGEPHAPAFEGLRLSADWRVYADGRRSADGHGRCGGRRADVRQRQNGRKMAENFLEVTL